MNLAIDQYMKVVDGTPAMKTRISVSNSGPTRKKSIKWAKKGPFFLKRGTKKGPIFVEKGTI